MIRSFADKNTQNIWEGKLPRRFGASLRTRMLDKLQILNAAKDLNDLRSPPGNRLELLHGNRRGQYSIRINDQWRLCFCFQDGDAIDVEITDYH